MNAEVHPVRSPDSMVRNSDLERSAMHTPGPWEVVEGSDYLSDYSGSHASIQQTDDGYVIAACVGDVAELDAMANARRIVQCVNAHDGLVKALQDLEALGGLGYTAHGIIRAALAKAGAA